MRFPSDHREVLFGRPLQIQRKRVDGADASEETVAPRYA
jgi:hypothetical protein